MIFSLLPDGLDLASGIVLIVASFFTSALTAAAGVGGGMIMLALMTYLLPVQVLIPIHGFVQFGSNAGRSLVQRAHINRKIAAWFLVGSLIGAIAGALLAVQLSESLLKFMLGAFILLLVWARFPAIRTVPPALLVWGGAGSALISMFAGASGPLVAALLNPVIEKHKELVATHGIAMTAQHGFKIFAFSIVGFSFWPWMPIILAMICAGFLGTVLGTKAMYTLPERYLKLGFKLVLTLVAVDLLRKSVM